MRLLGLHTWDASSQIIRLNLLWDELLCASFPSNCFSRREFYLGRLAASELSFTLPAYLIMIPELAVSREHKSFWASFYLDLSKWLRWLLLLLLLLHELFRYFFKEVVNLFVGLAPIGESGLRHGKVIIPALVSAVDCVIDIVLALNFKARLHHLGAFLLRFIQFHLRVSQGLDKVVKGWVLFKCFRFWYFSRCHRLCGLWCIDSLLGLGSHFVGCAHLFMIEELLRSSDYFERSHSCIGFSRVLCCSGWVHKCDFELSSLLILPFAFVLIHRSELRFSEIELERLRAFNSSRRVLFRVLSRENLFVFPWGNLTNAAGHTFGPYLIKPLAGPVLGLDQQESIRRNFISTAECAVEELVCRVRTCTLHYKFQP